MANQTLNLIGKQTINLYAHSTLKLDVQFQAPLPKGAKLIAPNHPTTIDPFVIPTIIREPVYILVTESAFKLPLLGRYLRAAGHIPVVTHNGRAAFETAKQLLLEGKTVAIFPEGALSPLDGGHSQAHTGVARLALMTGAPVIPVGIALETDHIRLKGAGVTDANGDEEIARLYPNGAYVITVGAPLYLNGMVEDRAYVNSMTAFIMQHIMRLSRQSGYRMQELLAASAQPAPRISPAYMQAVRKHIVRFDAARLAIVPPLSVPIRFSGGQRWAKASVEWSRRWYTKFISGFNRRAIGGRIGVAV